MSNPNNNKNFNDEALRINRALKKENDALSAIVDEIENFLLNINTQWEDDKQSERLQDMILKVRSRDAM
jgi:Na+/phosphate symporter|tara:strand:- start:60 stop:266 length:207 start_codon:yes stop_codon:yes gene_type:complete